MKFILIFLCLVQLCFQNKLTNELEAYENKILDVFNAPTPRKGFSLTIDIDWYNKHLVDVLQTVRNTDNDNYMNVDSDLHKFVCIMWSKGGPEFLKLNINNTDLQNKLKWSDEKMQEMYYSFGATQVLWDELRELNPNGHHYFKSFNKSDYDELLEIDKRGKLNELIDFTKLGDISN